MNTPNDTARHRATLDFYGRSASRAPRDRLDFDAVRAAAAGRWPAILPGLGIGPEFLRDRHGPCPGCGGHDRFRFDDRDGAGTWLCSAGGGAALAGDGFALLAHVSGWSPAECLRAVAEALGLRDGRDLPPVQPRQTAPAPASQPAPTAEARTRDRLRALWCAALPLDHDGAEPARRYLAARGLWALLDRGDLPADLRLHPTCAYWHAGPDGRPQRLAELPALVALVRGADGSPVGLHSTYLRPDGSGKAALADPVGNPLPARKLRTLAAGASRGAAIRLYPAGERLAIGEGIETCTAVRIADPALPVWAAVSAGGLAAVALPPEARELLLICDADPAGARATLTLASRARGEGMTVRLLVPEVRHGD